MSERGGLVGVRPIGGLCNRLRVISSFQVLAGLTGRELRVCWGPSVGFSDEDLSELFENEFERIDDVDFDRLCEDALCIHDAIDYVGGGARLWRDPGTAMREILDPTTHPVVTYRGLHPVDRITRPAAAAELPDSFSADYLSEFRRWRPVEPIRRIVDELAAEFDSRTIGVHVRRGDAINRHFRQSSDEAFFARMDPLVCDEPGTTFFLATDCGATDARFRERYGPVLRTNRAKRFVDSVPSQPKANQRDAVIDLFTLARTRHVLGTRHSSFSEAAADLGGAPLEVVLANPLRYRARWKLAEARRELRARARSIARRRGPRR